MDSWFKCEYLRRKATRPSAASSDYDPSPSGASDSGSSRHVPSVDAQKLGRHQELLEQNLAKLKLEANDTRELQTKFIADVSTAFSWLTSGTVNT